MVSERRSNSSPSNLESAIDHYLSEGGSINVRDDDYRTALHLAAGYGNITTSRILIEKGANIHARDRHGETPLTHAMANAIVLQDGAAMDIALLLCGSGSDINATNAKGMTALYWAASARQPGLVYHLIMLGANPNARRDDGSTALSLVCAMATTLNDVEVAKSLMVGGADPAISDEAGLSPRDIAHLKESGDNIPPAYKNKVIPCTRNIARQLIKVLAM
jgi:cytohesin